MKLDPAVEIILLVKAAFGRLDQDRQGKVNGIKLGMDQYIKLKNSNHIEVKKCFERANVDCQARMFQVAVHVEIGRSDVGFTFYG
jgi:hypothetical protein